MSWFFLTNKAPGFSLGLGGRKSDFPAPARGDILTPMTADVQYLFLDLNSYFASVEQQENPAYRGRPLAVVPTMTEKTCAIAASYEAKALGITTGTMIYEAKKLCPSLITVQARHDVYVDYHHAIMEELERHVPIETIHSVDEAACRLIGRECRVENAIRLAREIKAGIHKNIGPAIGCSIGLSCNSYLAKLATELQKPDGLVVLGLEDLPGRILHMGLTGLPWIARGVERRLKGSGITTVDQLWRLDAGRMRRIWGSVVGQRFWYMLHGEQVPPIKITKRMVGHSHVLAPKLRTTALAHLVARRLMVRAASRLRRMGYWAAEASASTRFVCGGGWGERMAMPLTQDSFTMTRAVDAMWRKLAACHGQRPIKQVSVVLSKLTREGDITLDLFDPEPGLDVRKHRKRIVLSHSLDGLCRRYGRDTVTYGIQPPIEAEFISTKIAFTRIPEREEFYE